MMQTYGLIDGAADRRTETNSHACNAVCMCVDGPPDRLLNVNDWLLGWLSVNFPPDVVKPILHAKVNDVVDGVCVVSDFVLPLLRIGSSAPGGH